MRIQTNIEEHLNAVTHGIGALLGIAGLVLLIVFSNSNIELSLFSVIVYGISIIVLFTASTLYHSVRKESIRHYFRIIDHISIYLLIAGTYTPVLLLKLNDSFGWPLFWIVWGVAFIGIILKIFYTGKFELFSTLLYLVMGWLIIFDFSVLSDRLDANGLLLFFAGGLSYTVGIIFYIFERIPFNHVIWHLFVLSGAICHFFMILFFIL